MSAIDRLLVMWSEPTKGGRHIIGHLDRHAGEIRFWYEADLSAARARGFDLLPEFPQHRTAEAPYTARYLFPLFAERIPAPTRPDAAEMMRDWGVEQPDDQFEVLAKSGGIRATDRLELAEYRAPDDGLMRPLEFRIASRGHIVDPPDLAVGDRVTLVPDPTNEVDSSAVIVDRLGRCAGYVPRQYTALVGSLFASEVAFEGEVIRKLIVPADVGKWVVRLSRR